jgi:hypothetical protein
MIQSCQSVQARMSPRSLLVLSSKRLEFPSRERTLPPLPSVGLGGRRAAPPGLPPSQPQSAARSPRRLRTPDGAISPPSNRLRGRIGLQVVSPVRRPKVTVCIGIACDDGAVLAADTQVTYGQSHKESKCKIGWFGDVGYSVGMAGSGYYDVLKESFESIESSVKKSNPSTPDEVQKIIQSVLASQKKQYGKREMDGQWLLCAICVRPQPVKLVKFWGNRPSTEAIAIVGCGDASVTAHLSSWLTRCPQSAAEGLLWASLIVAQAKEFVPFCGLETDALIVTPDAKVETIERGRTAHCEKYAKSLIETFSDALGRFAFASISESAINLQVSALSRRIKELHQKHFSNSP